MKRSSKPGYTSRSSATTSARNTVYPVGDRLDNTLYPIRSNPVYTGLDNIVYNAKPMGTQLDNRVYNSQPVYKGLSKILSKEPVYKSGLENKLNPLEQARRAYADGISPISDLSKVLVDCHKCFRRMTSCICYNRKK